MKVKSLLVTSLSFTLVLTNINVLANASISNTAYMPTNAVAGDYVVISNESTESTQSTGVTTFETAKKLQKPDSDSSIYQVDFNRSEIPEDLKNIDSSNFNYNKDIQNNYVVGDTKPFNVADLETNENYVISPVLQYSGKYCNVWVGDENLTKDRAIKMGEEFDNNIYSTVTNNFADPTDIDNNGKINLLCYDIKDGFNGSGGYTGGYFYGIDLYPQSQLPDKYHSNEGELLYIDTYPSMYQNKNMPQFIDQTKSYGVIAHELQHLVNFSENVIRENGDSMPIWINEGLSEACNQFYTKKPLTSRINYYNTSPEITNGQSLVIWGDNNSTLPNYSLSYLFLQYLRIQCGQGDTIYKELIKNTRNDEKCIEDVIHKYIDPNLSFGQFMTKFRMALLRNDKTGIYGFKNEAGFDKIQKKVLPTNPSNYSLKQGGAIVIKATSKNKTTLIPTDKGANIAYLGTYDASNPQDINKDDKVDSLDLALLSDKYNKYTTEDDWYQDTNKDGIFDIFDIISVSRMVDPNDIPKPGDTYDAKKIYVKGDTVVYQGKKYVAKWWTQGMAPDNSPSSPWQLVV